MSQPADHQMWADDHARVVVTDDQGQVQFHGTATGYAPPVPAQLTIRMDGKGQPQHTSVDVAKVRLEPPVDPLAGDALEALPGMNEAKAAEVLAALQDAGYEIVKRS